MKKIVFCFIIIFCLVSLNGISFGMSASPDTPITNGTFVSIIKNANPAVASVNVSFKIQQKQNFLRDPLRPRQRQNQMPPMPRPPGAGSGFLISEDGHMITNAHVVDGADKITVSFGDNKKKYPAIIVGVDKKTDIAVIKIDPKGKDLSFLKMGNSKNVEVGEAVIAIGNPFYFKQSATKGIISGIGRKIGGPYDDYFQIDALINPGNSGGPLLNIDGNVIGVNAAIFTKEGANSGIGFSIPINLAREITGELIKKGSITRGWLGVFVQPITPDFMESFGLKNEVGALVSDVVPNSPAEEAGINRGDVIISFNKEEISNMEALPKIVAAIKPDTTVSVVVIRNGEEKTIPVTIMAMNGGTTQKPKKVSTAPTFDKFGMIVSSITPKIMEQMGEGFTAKNGVIVSDVRPGGAAAEARLRKGDVIVEIDRKPITSVEEYNKTVAEVADKMVSGGKDDSSTLFLVSRNNATIYVPVKSYIK